MGSNWRHNSNGRGGYVEEPFARICFSGVGIQNKRALPREMQAKGDWKPPGTIIKTYTRQGDTFEIWCASLQDERCREIFEAAQVLVPLYIEGGVRQSLDDQPWTMERWKVFFIYRKTSSDKSIPYNVVGFSTSYRLWVLPSECHLENRSPASMHNMGTMESEYLNVDENTTKFERDPLENHSRERISQFLILPPYQGQSHGGQLYDSMMDHFMSDRNVFEISVEDPSEAYDDLRDLCDLHRLRTLPGFANVMLTPTLSPEHLRSDTPVPVDHLLTTDTKIITSIRHQTKISPRQFGRLLEMHLLDKIPPMHRNMARITRKAAAADVNDRKYYFWRLLVKERLFRHNYDALKQLDHSERVTKVEETVDSVLEGHERLLGKVGKGFADGDAYRNDGKHEEDNKSLESGVNEDGKMVKLTIDNDNVVQRRKRIVIEDKDEDSDASAAKKQRQ